MLLIAFSSLSLVCAQGNYGDNEEAENSGESIKVLVLGTFHFANAPDFNDIDAPEQQKEVESLVENLRKFKPTKIALEFQRKDTAVVDSIYNEYLNRNHELTVNERQQIGFRLARQSGHSKVYSIDYKKPWGMKKVLDWAEKNDPGFMKFFQDWQKEHAEWDSVLHKNKTIGEILSLYNKEEKINELQSARMRTLEVGAGDNYIGVEPVASVYKRNMRIFANLTEIAEPGDRILIVYGLGHAYFFHEFVGQHPDMEIVDIFNYLNEEK